MQRFVLQTDLLSFFVVGRESKAACAAKRISGNCFEPIESRFGALPQLLRRLGAVRLARDVVASGAAAEQVRVRIRYGDKLELEIRDDGAAAVTKAGGTAGSGLIGMRERVALLGGVLAAGAVPGGGYRVAAEIPIAEAT